MLYEEIKRIDKEIEQNDRLEYLAFLNSFGTKGSSIVSSPQNYNEELIHRKICFGKTLMKEEKECLPLELASCVSKDIKEIFDNLEKTEIIKQHRETSRKILLEMQKTFQKEEDRNHAFLSILQPLLGIKETTDNASSVYSIRKNSGPDGFKLTSSQDPSAIICIFEGKLDIGCCGDPTLQACFDHSKLCGKMAEAGVDGHYPCLLLTLAGCQITVSLAMVSKTVVVYPLIDAFLFQRFDKIAKGAKLLSCIERSLNRINHYYETKEWLSTNVFSVPHIHSTVVHGISTSFHYKECLKIQPQESYVYLVETEDTREKWIVKFTLRYSEQIHQLLSNHHYAPTLYSVQQISTEYKMIVMEYISKPLNYFRLYSKIENTVKIIFRQQLQEILQILHSNGFLHGDLRRPNILLTIDPEPRVYVIDFDWSGRIDEVTYPDNIDLGNFPWILVEDLPWATIKHDTKAIQEIIDSLRII